MQWIYFLIYIFMHTGSRKLYLNTFIIRILCVFYKIFRNFKSKFQNILKKKIYIYIEDNGKNIKGDIFVVARYKLKDDKFSSVIFYQYISRFICSCYRLVLEERSKEQNHVALWKILCGIKAILVSKKK